MLFDTLGAEMSKAVLGQTLTTEQGARGSQALGRVHDNVRRDLLEADAKAIAAVLKRDILAPLVRMNFGPDAMVPTFQFMTEDAQDMSAFFLSVLNLQTAGVRVPQKWVRDELGIPEPEDGEELVGDGLVDPAAAAVGPDGKPADKPPPKDKP